MFMKFPGAMWRLRIVWPLLIDKGSGIRKHAVIKLGMIPGHDQGTGAAGAAAHSRPAVGILGQLHVSFHFDHRQDFLFHKLGIESRHGVVLKAALTSLRVAASVAD